MFFKHRLSSNITQQIQLLVSHVQLNTTLRSLLSMTVYLFCNDRFITVDDHVSWENDIEDSKPDKLTPVFVHCSLQDTQKILIQCWKLRKLTIRHTCNLFQTNTNLRTIDSNNVADWLTIASYSLTDSDICCFVLLYMNEKYLFNMKLTILISQTLHR